MMKVSKISFKYLLIAALLLQMLVSGINYIPVTGGQVGQFDILIDPVESNPDSNESSINNSETAKAAILQEFVNSVADGEAGIIRGIYAEDNFKYPVIQQPSSQPAFVSEHEDMLTEFSLSKKYGVTGMLAHNFLAGLSFFTLETDDILQVVFGDGTIQTYTITEILKYQALSPDSPTSSFLDLDSGETLTATQLFKRVYTGTHHLTLQTCIQVGSEDSWGRLFLIAEPLL